MQVTIESIQQRLGSMGATSDVQRERNLFRALMILTEFMRQYEPEAVTPTTFEQFAGKKLPNCELAKDLAR